MRGYFDAFPADDRTEFYGSWGNYPYFGDGKVVVTGSDEGVFVLQSTAPRRTPYWRRSNGSTTTPRNAWPCRPAVGTFRCGVDLQALDDDPERANRLERSSRGPMGPSRLALGKPVIAAGGMREGVARFRSGQGRDGHPGVGRPTITLGDRAPTDVPVGETLDMG